MSFPGLFPDPYVSITDSGPPGSNNSLAVLPQEVHHHQKLFKLCESMCHPVCFQLVAIREECESGTTVNCHGMFSCARLLTGDSYPFSFLRRKLVTLRAEEDIALCFSIMEDPSCRRFCFLRASALHVYHQPAADVQVGVCLLVICVSELFITLRKLLKLRRSEEHILHVPSSRYTRVCWPLLLWLDSLDEEQSAWHFQLWQASGQM